MKKHLPEKVNLFRETRSLFGGAQSKLWPSLILVDVGKRLFSLNLGRCTRNRNSIFLIPIMAPNKQIGGRRRNRSYPEWDQKDILGNQIRVDTVLDSSRWMFPMKGTWSFRAVWSMGWPFPVLGAPPLTYRWFSHDQHHTCSKMQCRGVFLLIPWNTLSKSPREETALAVATTPN